VKLKGLENIFRSAVVMMLPFFLAACESNAAPTVFSFVKAPLTKATTTLSIDWSILGQSGRFAISSVTMYRGARLSVIAPVGWTLIRDDSTTTFRQLLYWHFIEANDKTVQIWSFSQPVDAQAIVVLLDGVALKDPIDATSSNHGSGNPLIARSVTTSSDGDLILAIYSTDFVGTAPGHDLPDNMSEIADQVESPDPYWIFERPQNHRGETGDSLCKAGQGFSWIASEMAIKRKPLDHRAPSLPNEATNKRPAITLPSADESCIRPRWHYRLGGLISPWGAVFRYSAD
jgi:hypothetical protein